MVVRSMPPELSAPSLSSTMAPSGSDDDSASTRSSVSPMRVAGSVAGELLGLWNPLRLLAELVEPHLESLAQRFQQAAVEHRLGGRLARAGGIGDATCCANRPPARPLRSAAAAAWPRSAPDARAETESAPPWRIPAARWPRAAAPLSMPWWRRTCQNSSPAAARMASASSHSGQGVRKTNWPLWKTLAGYLKRSSNMKSWDLWTMDVLIPAKNYRNVNRSIVS